VKIIVTIFSQCCKGTHALKQCLGDVMIAAADDNAAADKGKAAKKRVNETN